MSTINMDAVVTELHKVGYTAYVEQTGGGCATIFAGPTHTDDFGDKRWAACAGPGWFEGPGWTNGRGDTEDFYIGPDDGGEGAYVKVDTDDPREIADAIVKQITGDKRTLAAIERTHVMALGQVRQAVHRVDIGFIEGLPTDQELDDLWEALDLERRSREQ